MTAQLVMGLILIEDHDSPRGHRLGPIEYHNSLEELNGIRRHFFNLLFLLVDVHLEVHDLVEVYEVRELIIAI